MKLYSDWFWPMVILFIVLIALSNDKAAEKVDLPGPKVQDRMEVTP